MKRIPAAALIAGALVLASCARDAEPAEPAVPSSPSSSSPAHGSLADCLQDHGVPAAAAGPAVLGPPAGVPQETWDEAMKACSRLAPGPAAP